MDIHDFYRDFSHPNVKKIIDQFTSTSLQHGKQISEMSRILEQISSPNVTKLYRQSDILKELQTIQSVFDSRISKIIDNTSSLAGINSKLLDDALSSLSRGVRISELAKSSLHHQLQVSEPLKSLQSYKELYSSFSLFSTSYSDLTTSAERIILAKPNSARVVSELSALEVLNNVDILETVSTSEVEIDNKDLEVEVEIENQVCNRDLEQEKQSIKNEVFKGVEQIETLLINIGSSDLVPMWQGAKAALNSIENPDYARQFTVSLRELFNHIIHRLSPDDEINNWSGGNKELFHNGKPTRRARLLYICRSVNHDIFSDFVDKDIKAILAMIDVFHRGTHQVNISLTHKQLIVLQNRIKYAINFLIETSLLNE